MSYSIEMGAYEEFCLRMGVINVDTIRLAIEIDNGLVRPNMQFDESRIKSIFLFDDEINEQEESEVKLTAE